MAIDFSLSPEQLTLQRDAREFAHDHLRSVSTVAGHLPTAAERFLATRPMYQELVRAGFMRRLIPQPYGGEGTGLIDMAIVAEELYTVDPNVSLTLLSNLLGLMPVYLGWFYPDLVNRLVKGGFLKL